MAVSVTGPRAVNELGGSVIPGRELVEMIYVCCETLSDTSYSNTLATVLLSSIMVNIINIWTKG